jgi:hypothetical protein
MAAITAALVTGAAVSAGTIAAGVSTAAAVGGAAMSFKQAGDARAKASEATQAADKAIAEAKKNLDVNFYDVLGIQKEPYELQREALLAQGAEAVRAGQESERGVAATAGRIQMAQNEAQAGIRTAMGQELSGLEKLSAAEDSRLRDVGAQISMEEAAGAQLARANFENMAGRAETQGMQGLVGAGQSLASSIPLYMKDVSFDMGDIKRGLGIGRAAAAQDAATAQRIQSNAMNAIAPQLQLMKPNFQGINNPSMNTLNRNMYLESSRGTQFDYNNQANAYNNPFAVYQV